VGFEWLPYFAVLWKFVHISFGSGSADRLS
jgi:hypothetical protein